MLFSPLASMRATRPVFLVLSVTQLYYGRKHFFFNLLCPPNPTFLILYQDKWTTKVARVRKQKQGQNNKSKLFFSFMFLGGLTRQTLLFACLSLSITLAGDTHELNWSLFLKTTYTPSPGSSFNEQNNHSSSFILFFHTLTAVSLVGFSLSQILNKTNIQTRHTTMRTHTHTRCCSSLSTHTKKRVMWICVNWNLKAEVSQFIRWWWWHCVGSRMKAHTHNGMFLLSGALLVLLALSDWLWIYLQKIDKGKNTKRHV